MFPAAEDGRALCFQQQSAAEGLGKIPPRQRAEHPSRQAVELAHGPATPLQALTQKKQRESLQETLAHPCSWQRNLQNQTVDAAVWPIHTTEQNPALKRKEVPTLATAQMNVEDAVPSEVSPAQRDRSGRIHSPEACPHIANMGYLQGADGLAEARGEGPRGTPLGTLIFEPCKCVSCPKANKCNLITQQDVRGPLASSLSPDLNVHLQLGPQQNLPFQIGVWPRSPHRAAP